MDESAGRIVNNLVVILTVYISIFSSLYIAMVGGVMSVKTELSKLTEDPARISNFEIFSNELFSGLYSLILKSAGLLIIFTVVGMLVLEAFQRYLHKNNMWELLYYEEMMRLLNIEKERRNVKIAEMSMNKMASRNNKFKKKKEK